MSDLASGAALTLYHLHISNIHCTMVAMGMQCLSDLIKIIDEEKLTLMHTLLLPHMP